MADTEGYRIAHHDCGDCWYSCATLTCDEGRASDECDCGADRANAHIARLEAENERLRGQLERIANARLVNTFGMAEHMQAVAREALDKASPGGAA